MYFIQMDYFITAAKCLSFTKAANVLYLTQSALSQQIIKLENELDMKLFFRDRRSLRLTPAGEVLLKEFQSISAMYQNALALARNAENDYTGRLRIGFLDGLEITEIMNPLLEYMSEQFPKVDVALFTMGYERLATWLYDGRLDLAFTQKFDAEERADISYDFLLRTSECLAISKNNPLATLESTTLEVLRDTPLIAISENDHDISLRIILEACAELGFCPTFKPSPSFYANKQWVKANKAVAIVDSISQLLKEPDICMIPLKQFRDSSLVLAYYDNNFNPVCNPVRMFLQEYIKEKITFNNGNLPSKEPDCTELAADDSLENPSKAE